VLDDAATAAELIAELELKEQLCVLIEQSILIDDTTKLSFLQPLNDCIEATAGNSSTESARNSSSTTTSSSNNNASSSSSNSSSSNDAGLRLRNTLQLKRTLVDIIHASGARAAVKNALTIAMLASCLNANQAKQVDRQRASTNELKAK
jgi:hypothetical protein